jgi:ABC-type microcin C transport system duplicated ATPase subunit YejF
MFFENENLIKASAATLKSLKKMQIIFQDPLFLLKPKINHWRSN